MVTNKDRNQQQIFDRWDNMGDKRRSLLDQSWAGLFREELLGQLPTQELAVHFCSDFGRPGKDLATCLGVALFQQVFDLTDEQTQYKIAFDEQWHYALDLPEQDDALTYFSLKTIWNVRQKLLENGIDRKLFEVIGDRLVEVFEVDGATQRLDSVHIQSNMKKLGRIGVIGKTIKKFLRNLKRQHPQAWQGLDSALADNYMGKDSGNLFSKVKPSASRKTLKQVCRDLLGLVEGFSNTPEITRMNSYQLMQRVVEEQCDLVESDGSQSIEVKAPKDIPSDSLQNPSDPDASYDGHKGQGYQVQLMETCQDAAGGDEAEDENEVKDEHSPKQPEDEDSPSDNKLRLITHIAVEPAHNSDQDALLPAIASTCQRGLKPKQLQADAGYGGDAYVEEAKNQNVAVIAPVKGRPPGHDQLGLAAHRFNRQHELTECAGGRRPVKQSSEGSVHHIMMDKSGCADCEMRGQCPMIERANYNYLRYSDKQLRLSKRRAHEQTQEFKNAYRLRAGVEATMSEYDRRTGVKQLRVRGQANVRYAATLKATGINLLRATRHRNTQKVKTG